MAQAQIDPSVLQPLKDLADNWEIDVAAYLEDYLEDLHNMVVSFNNGVLSMNFVQSAMLLQGSTGVYSKKVEHVFNLLFKIFDMTVNRKKSTAAAADKEGTDADDDNDETEECEEFLTLDDIDDGKYIYLKENFEAGEPFRCLPEIPLCLLRIDEGEKGENPLVSKSGEVLGSRDDFRINTGRLHYETGVFLLDLSHLVFMEKLLTEMSQQHTEQCNTGPGGEGDVRADAIMEDIQMQVNISGDNDYLPMDNAGDEIDGDLSAMNTSAAPPEQGHNNLRRSGRERRLVHKPENTPNIDPWKMEDAYTNTKPVKQFIKKDTTWKKCPGLEEDKKTKKRKRKILQNDDKNAVESLMDFGNKTCFSHVEKFPKDAQKRPLHSVAEQMFWVEFKRRQVLHKEIGKKHKALIGYEAEAEEEDGGHQLLPDRSDVEVDDIAPLVDDNLFDAIGRGLEEHESITDPYHLHDNREEDVIITSYEELVQKYVEEYMISAQEYAHITDLSRRVSDWEEKVLPRLQEEESHEPYDINKYGSRIINNLHRGNFIKFHKIVQGKPAFEICRIFLASLMLANTSNVKIESRGQMEAGMDKFELELLSTQRLFEELQEYQAPSRCVNE